MEAWANGSPAEEIVDIAIEMAVNDSATRRRGNLRLDAAEFAALDQRGPVFSAAVGTGERILRLRAIGWIERSTVVGAINFTAAALSRLRCTSSREPHLHRRPRARARTAGRNHHGNLIAMASRSWPRASTAKFSDEQRPELQNPSPHRFRGDIQTVLSGPAPAPLHQVAGVRLALDRAHDRCRVRDLDVLSRLDVGLALGEADFDLELGKAIEQRRRSGQQSIVVAYRRFSQLLAQARSNLASNPAQTEAPLSATRSLSWRVSPDRLKLAEPVRNRRWSTQ